MLDVIILVYVLVGARLSSACIGFYCHCQGCCHHDGVAGTSLDPMVWSVGAPKRRRVVHAVRDGAFLLWPPGIWEWGVGRCCCDSHYLS